MWSSNRVGTWNVGIVAVVGVLTLTGAATVAVARPRPGSGGVGSVGNPPALLNGKKTFTVKFKARSVPKFFLSSSPGNRRGAHHVKSRSHGTGKATLSVPRHLAFGAYFVLACSGGRCVGSKKPGVVQIPRAGSKGAPRPAPPARAALDSAATVTATIGKNGGTIHAAGPGGTRYTLVINRGSLAQNTVIAMTPLRGLSEAKLHDKFVGGVQFAPEGLLLVHGGTLTIKPKKGVPARRRVALGYDAGGTHLHVVPVTPKDKQIQIPIAHFSGASAENSSDGGGPSGEPPPSDNSGFYGQLLSQLIADQANGDFDNADFQSAAASILNDYLNAIMKEEVPPGLNDDDAAQTAIRDLLDWARTEALVLGKVDELPDVSPTILKLLEGVYKRAQQRCAAHDLSQIPRILDTDRTEQLVTGNEHHTIPDDVKCLKFKISFDSSIQDAGGNFNGEFDMEVVSNPTVQVDPANLLLTGQAPDTYSAGFPTGSKTQSFTCPGGGNFDETDTMTGSKGDTLKVLKLVLPDLSTLSAPGAAQTIQLVIDPGIPEERLDINKTGDCPSDQTVFEPFWEGDFLSTPMAGMTPAPFGDSFAFIFTLTLANGQADIANQTFTGTDSSGNSGNAVSEQTTIDIMHTPPGP
jgi:hypothetical protein